MNRLASDVLTALGILGGLAFVLGSIFFLRPNLYEEGVYLFIFGSIAMLVERLGKIWLERYSSSSK